jgi:hypothetical protein
MSEKPEPNKELNRLRAAVALIPIIESGLNRSTLSHEKAALMSEFCMWASEHGIADDQLAQRLAAELQKGLERMACELRARGFSAGIQPTGKVFQWLSPGSD